MKFGVVTYRNTANLGDDIQSYAQLKFLPSVDYHIERENLDTFQTKNGETVSAIMNGWYLYAKYNWPPSHFINPLCISMHVSENDPFEIGFSFMSGLGGDYLKHYGPVGARDQSSIKAFEQYGIPAYFSGCLTLTLDSFPDVERSRRIVLCDLDEDLTGQLRTSFPEAEFELASHDLDWKLHSELSFEARCDIVETMLKKYQSSSFVITTRLHCALPCLAIGVPVILVNDGDGLDRLGTYLDFIHHCESKDLLEKIRGEQWMETPLPNPDKHLGIRSELIRQCEDFVESASRGIVHEPFNVTVDEVHPWQKSLLRSRETPVLAALAERDNWIVDLDESNAWNAKQLASMTARNEELQEWITQLEKAKDGLGEHVEELQGWTLVLQLEIERFEKQAESNRARIQELESWVDYEEKAKHVLAELSKSLERQIEDERKEHKQSLSAIKKSRSWRIGRAVTWLPRIIKRKLKPSPNGQPQ